MPWGASSSARQRAAWMRAAFEAQYAVLFRRTTCRPMIEATRTMRPATPSRDEVPRARLGEEQRSPRVHAERAVPLLGRHLEEGSGIEGAGCVDEDVEAAVRAHDVADQVAGELDLRKVGGMAPSRRPQPLDRALELAAGGRRTRPARRRRRAPRRRQSRCPRCAPVTSATRPSSRHDSGAALRHGRAMIASTSTGMSNGRCGTPTDVRAASRSSPYRSRIRSEKPLITRACSVKPSTAFT